MELLALRGVFIGNKRKIHMKICDNLLNGFKLKKIINIENINIYLLKTKNTTNISGIALLKDLIDKGLAAVQEIDGIIEQIKTFIPQT